MVADTSSESLPPTELRRWAEGTVGPLQDLRLLSSSNSRVWLAGSSEDRWVLKHLRDLSSTPDVEQRLLDRLGSRPGWRHIIASSRQADGSTYVLAPYLTGDLIADVMPQATEAQAAKWFEELLLLIDQVRSVPVTGFGSVRLGSDGDFVGPHDSWPAFLLDYLRSQRDKGPRLAARTYRRLAATVERLAPELASAAPTPQLALADINLRNFLSVDGKLVCINVPGLWSGDPHVTVGEALLHWPTAVSARILDGAGAARRLVHLYAAVHAYVILAYVERFSPEPLETAVPWGGTVPLMTLLDRHLNCAVGGKQW